MSKADLNELEKQALALADPKDREEALRAIAELRAMQSGRFVLPKPPPPPPPPAFPDTRDLQSRGLARLVKLLVGTVAFLALCFSLLTLVLPIGQLLDAGASTHTYGLLFAAIAAVAVSAAVLLLAARGSRAERAAVAQNPIARQFARRKLVLNLSTLGLAALAISAMVPIMRAAQDVRYLVYVVMFGFLFGYFMLSRALWRCPNCGAPLPNAALNTSGSVRSCPSCKATLQ